MEPRNSVSLMACDTDYLRSQGVSPAHVSLLTTIATQGDGYAFGEKAIMGQPEEEGKELSMQA